MEKIILESEQRPFFNGLLRIIFGAAGLLYMLIGLTELYPTWDLKWGAIVNAALGLALTIAVIWNPAFGADIELVLDDDYLKSIEDNSMRTVYWENIDHLELQQFSFTVYYANESAEEFRLPYLNSEEFEELRQYLHQKSEQLSFDIQEKSWWNVF